MATPEGDEWQDIQAERHLNELMRQGKAREILDTWSFCNQSCDYVYGIVRHVAEEGTSISAQDFARNLLDDWNK
jgi:hypothetical protein